MHRARFLRALSVLIFAGGILLGLALSATAVGVDFEASRLSHDLTLLRDASLSTLRCPVLLDSQETGAVRASFKNSLDRPVILLIRAHISRYLTLKREELTHLPLEPGQKQTVEWAVDAEDIVYQHLILVKVHQHRYYPLLGRTASCGIVVLDLPGLTGSQAVAAVVAVSLLGIALGLGLWAWTARPLRASSLEVVRAMEIVAASAVLAMLATLLGWSLLGIVALVATLLLIASVLGFFLARR